MHTPKIYKYLSKYPEIIEMLNWPFDFIICNPYYLSEDWPITLSDELIVLATDGSGGAYTIIKNINPDESPVIFLSSEGEAGKVASNFSEFLSILVDLPYWSDLLKYSVGGEITQSKKALPYLQKELLDDEPDISDKQNLIYKTLNLDKLIDPIQTLYNSLKSDLAIEIKADDGSSYESLFNTFSINDNPYW